MIETIKNDILLVISQYPGIDDEEIAAILGMIPVEVSAILRDLQDEGLIQPNSNI